MNTKLGSLTIRFQESISLKNLLPGVAEWHYSGFHKLDEIGNDANIGIRDFTT